MPAMLDDPDSPPIYRASGAAPYPDPHDPNPSLPAGVIPRVVTLRDRVTIATIVPFSSPHRIPRSLLNYLCDQINIEIENGDTYPMIDPLSHEKFAPYWFQNFGAIMLLGTVENAEDLIEDRDWATECLGSFYIKPNYPGRSSHVCNAGFLVTNVTRNRGVGRLMGEAYLDWAPKLGYTYSVFNLVYETNVASCRIWDALGFKRIGRVKGCGNLKSYPGQLIDAIIYGRDLGPDGEDFVSEERFHKIKFYLKFGKYPNGADRAEKSRLRSAAAHYKLVDGDKLMLKDKEVISDPQRQYEIARRIHVAQHSGINKTTATIAESYHWVRIKETVSLVIRNCAECKEMGKAPTVRADGVIARRPIPGQGGVSAAGRLISLPSMSDSDTRTLPEQYGDPFSTANSLTMSASSSPHTLDNALQRSIQDPMQDSHQQHMTHQQQHPAAPMAQLQHHLPDPNHGDYLPLDPQIMEDVRTQLGNYNSQSHTHPHSLNPPHTNVHSLSHTLPHSSYMSHPHQHQHHHQHGHQHQSPHQHGLSSDTYQAMIAAHQHQHQQHIHNPNHHQDHTLTHAHPHAHTPAHGQISDDSSGENGDVDADADGDGDLDMLIADDEDGDGVGVSLGVDIGTSGGDSSKARAQAQAQAAEAAMRGDDDEDADDDAVGDGVEGLYD